MNYKVSRFLILTITLFMSLSLTGCEEYGTESFACTAEFVTISLQLQNPDGEPVEDADISVTNLETGRELQVCESFECNNGQIGRYVIFHDGLMDRVTFQGDAYKVNGETSEGSFSENFVFAKNECHVLKKSGPDTVTVS